MKKDLAVNSKICYNTHMTTKQIKWAASHDWFTYAKLAQGVVYVRDYNEKNEAFEREFTDFSRLREWAGY